MKYISRLNSDQISQALKNSISLWSGGKTHAQIVEKFMRIMGDEKILSMAGLLDLNGNVASSLKRYIFSMDSENGVIKTVALGAIFTRDNFRNRGFAKHLIENVLQEAKNDGCGASLLFSDIGTAYYEKFGFQALQDLRWVADAKHLLNTINAPLLTIRAATLADTETLMNWYEQSFPKGHLRLLRNSKEVWDFQRERSDAKGDYIISFEGNDVGYFNANAVDDRLLIHEYVLLEQKLENNFVATLAQFSLNNNREAIAGWLRADKIPNGFVGQSRNKAIPMINFFDKNLKLPENDSQVHFGTIDHV